MSAGPAPAGTALEVSALEVERGGRVVLALDALVVAPGERLAVLGPSGAGKTSLLLALVGAVAARGRICVAGSVLTRDTLSAIRARVGFAFADPGDQLFCDRVDDEVAFGPRQLGLGDVPTRVAAALARVSLTGFEARHPQHLSLGEQRRLALAAALATDPALLLLDEPTAGLDPRARRDVLRALGALPATLVIATHDLDAVLDLDARCLLVQAGRAVTEGQAATLLRDRATLEAAGLELPLSLSGRA